MTALSRSEWVSDDVMSHVLAALTPPNRLAILCSLFTGLRISDVLSLKTSCLSREKFTIVEQKTLKKRLIRLPLRLRAELTAQAGKIWVFEHRLDPLRHRSRQAVYKDIRRAAKAFRVGVRLTPHSARKIYAVAEYKKSMDVAKVKRLLNHSSEAVTMIYAIADELTEKKKKKRL